MNTALWENPIWRLQYTGVIEMQEGNEILELFIVLKKHTKSKNKT